MEPPVDLLSRKLLARLFISLYCRQPNEEIIPGKYMPRLLA